MVSPVEEIKARLDAVEFINGYVKLQKAGINYKAPCPFHTEKTPSFFVSPTRQLWHCFGGCGKGGDIFKFVMEIEGCDFPEALKLLAQRAGVVLRREDPSVRSERNLLYDICEEASKIFEKNLSLTPAVRSYLKKRGVTDETIQEFRIGFATQSWDFLIKALGAKKFKTADIEKAGLAVRSRESASWYDRFRSRIIFPITDLNGRAIGFGGRIFDEFSGVSIKDGVMPSFAKTTEEGQAKYINTPQTLIYDKSRVIYGFNKAKQAIREKNSAVVVEGYMDCVMSQQAGVKNTIAVSGTVLTPYQLKILRRLCGTVICSFDVDTAGASATKRSLELAEQFDFERRIAVIPSGKDPADAVLENPGLWQKAVSNAKPVIEFYFDKTFKENDPRTAAGKKAISSVLIPLISELSGEIEKAHWVGELSKLLVVPENAVWIDLGRLSKENGSDGRKDAEETPRVPRTRRELLEERLLVLLSMLDSKTVKNELAGYDLRYISSRNQGLLLAITSSSDVKGAIAETPQLLEGINLLKFKGEVLSSSLEDVRDEFASCRRELEKECVKEELSRLAEEIARTEKEGNMDKVSMLLTNFNELSNKLRVGGIEAEPR